MDGFRLPRALGALLVVALLTAPVAMALPREELVVYLDERGHFHAGLGVVGIGDAGAGSVNLATYSAEVDDCRRWLRIYLDYAPRNATLDTPAAFLAMRYELQARLFNDTSGEALPYGTLTWTSPGTQAYAIPEATPLRVELALVRGAEVDYNLRVSGWVHPDAECSWRGQVFISELEQNPSGTDAGNEWLEIHNGGLRDLDLAGWRLQTTHGRVEEHVFAEGVVLPQGERLVVRFDRQFLDNEDESVVLVAPRGWEIDRTPVLSDFANDDRTWQRASDFSDEWVFQRATPGLPAT